MNITNADIEFSKKYQAALDELIRNYHLAANNLTERQLAEAIRQAIACGDFERHVCVSNSCQAVVYTPFALLLRLEARIRELEAEIEILRDYDDKPD